MQECKSVNYNVQYTVPQLSIVKCKVQECSITTVESPHSAVLSQASPRVINSEALDRGGVTDDHFNFSKDMSATLKNVGQTQDSQLS